MTCKTRKQNSDRIDEKKVIKNDNKITFCTNMKQNRKEALKLELFKENTLKYKTHNKILFRKISRS